MNNIILINNLRYLPKYFNKFGKKISNTYELNNVILSYKNVAKLKKKHLNILDIEEREWIINETNKVVKKIKKNKYTRQAIFYNMFKAKLEHNCLNTFHFYFRENKLNLNVYVRSMNYDTNFKYDLNTFNYILNKTSKKLKLKKGQIIVFIMSLHKLQE